MFKIRSYQCMFQDPSKFSSSMSTIHSIESMLKELNGQSNSVTISEMTFSSGKDLLSSFEIELDGSQQTDMCSLSDETFTSADMPNGDYVGEESKNTSY